jgi:hypothetical protein
VTSAAWYTSSPKPLVFRLFDLFPLRASDHVSHPCTRTIAVTATLLLAQLCTRQASLYCTLTASSNHESEQLGVAVNFGGTQSDSRSNYHLSFVTTRRLQKNVVIVPLNRPRLPPVSSDVRCTAPVRELRINHQASRHFKHVVIYTA